MVKESEPADKKQGKEGSSDYVPVKLPTMITPFNIGEVMSIRAMNERNEARSREKSKKA